VIKFWRSFSIGDDTGGTRSCSRVPPSRYYNLRMALKANFLLFLACLITPIMAQEPQITSNMEVDSSLLHKWLHSGDPRLIAWAAEFARRRHDGQLISEIPSMLEHWSMPPIAGGYEEQAAQRRAALALLDTLIQEKVQVSMPVIRSQAEAFPAQALLLVEHVPLTSSNSTLVEWAFNRDGIINGTRSRAAAMILAKNPESSFVYDILKGLIQHVTIRIVSPGPGGVGSGGSSCGDSFPLPPTPGWPQVYAYDLRENNADSERNASDAVPVVKLGNHNIEAERHEENSGWGGCTTPQSDAAFRHELLAYWLEIKPRNMAWQPAQSFTIVWTTKAAYEKEVGLLVEADRVAMSDTRQQLRHRGLLDEQMIDGTFPQIAIAFECEIAPCPLAGGLPSNH